jgi:thiopeptide-type bacteriocin biosynthesis protein
MAEGQGATFEPIESPTSRIIVRDRYGQRAAILIDDRLVPLSTFLLECGRSLAADCADDSQREVGAFRRTRDNFVRAGLEGLAANSSADWIQIGVRPSNDGLARRELFGIIAATANTLLNDEAIANFFFMHKPPGIRLRFEQGRRGAPDLADWLYGEVARWRSEGLVDLVEPGVYEPESALFGGPQSMRFVHALSTVDSTIWLDFHSRTRPESEAGDEAWLVSLAVLRSVFDGLDIVGWEDLGVWERIRTSAGRRLAPGMTDLPGFADLARHVRAVWSRSDDPLDHLGPGIGRTVAASRGAIHLAAAQWRSGYFNTRAARIGPRAAAAYFVIFHWNRGAIPAERQALLTEVLARGEG